MQLLLDLRDIFEHGQRVFDGHFEQIGNGIAFVAHGERFGVVAAAATDFAGDVNIGKKIHFDAAQTVALTGFAATSFDIEAEAAGAIAAFAGLGKHGEKFANRAEDAGVGGGIRARGAADGRLVDFDDFVEMLEAENGAMGAGSFAGTIKLLREGAIENVVDQRGFAGAGNAGDDGEQAEREFDVDVFQVVGVGTEDFERFAVGFAALRWHGNFQVAGEITSGERICVGGDFRRRADGDNLAARFSRAGAEVHDEIGAANGFLVVLDHEDGVAEVAQGFERTKQTAIVAGVQADGRLIENIQNAAQARADLRREANALGFSSGERGGGAVEGEIAEADGEKKLEALGDFVERASGDGKLARRETGEDFIDGSACVGQRKFREFGDGIAADFYRETLRAQALLPAHLAGRRRHVLREIFAIFVGGGFLEIALEMVDDALEIEAFGWPAVGGIAVENQVLHAVRELFKGRVEVEAIGKSSDFQGPLQGGGSAAGAQAPLEKRFRPVDDDLRRVKIEFRA